METPRRDDDFLARLAAARPALSPKMAQLAAYISEDYLRAAFMTARELAAAAGVSLATVVRFPSVLGYQNVAALRAAIQDRVNADLGGVERLRTLPLEDRTPSTLLRQIIDADIDGLRSLAHTFVEADLDRFVAALLAAESVTVVGSRYVGPLAGYFAYSLAKVRPRVAAFTAIDSTLYDHVRLMGAGDLLVAIVFARYPADAVALVRAAHRAGVRIVAITDTPLSPVAPLAEVSLYARATSLTDFVGSLAAPAALINCVASEAALRLGDAALERLQRIEDAAAEAGIYVRDGSRPPRIDEALLAWQPAASEPSAGRGPGA